MLLHLIRMSLVAGSLAVVGPAYAASEPLRFVICQPGGPDLAREQQEVLRALYRYVERRTGLPEGGIEGIYTHTRAGCHRALKRAPSVVFPSLPMFTELRRTLDLEAVAQLQVEGRVRDRFYLMVRTDDEVTAPSLSGRRLVGTHVYATRFVGEVALSGLVDLATVELVPVKRVLRGIRAVIREKADAVLLDGFQYRALQATAFAKKLKVVHVSREVPTPPVAVVAGRAPAGFGARLARALVDMDRNPEGQRVLKLFRIEGFAIPEPRTYAQIEAGRTAR